MDTVYRLRQTGIEWQHVDGEHVGVDTETGRYVSLNGSAAVLLPALQGGASIPDLAAVLNEKYGIDADRAREDATAFLDSLAKNGLLEARA
jgi:hypothetical protein